MINNLRNVIKQIYNYNFQFFTGMYKTYYQKPSSKSLISVDMRLWNAQAAIRAIEYTFGHGEIEKQWHEDVGRRGVELVQEVLQPISRSGKTAASFKYTYDPIGKEIIIFSDEDSAYHIQYGFREAGSVQDLTDWMQYKSEFAGKSEKEKTGIAYAIRNRIESGKTSGARSDITKLPPVGQRKYEYLEEMLKKLEPEIDIALKEYKL